MSRLITSENLSDSRMIWSALYNDQISRTIPAHVAYSWCDSVYNLNMANVLEKLPSLIDIKARMDLIPAYGKVDNDEFFKRLSVNQFTVNMKLRSLEEISYLEERDYFHDMFGHVPHLFDGEYCEALRLIGNIHVAFKNNPIGKKFMENVYWRIFEFGALVEDGETKALGAGIISSPAEFKHFRLETRKLVSNFDIKTLCIGDNQLSEFQDVYFVFESMEDIVMNILEAADYALNFTGINFESWSQVLEIAEKH